MAEWTIHPEFYRATRQEGEEWSMEASASLPVADFDDWDGDARKEQLMEEGAGAVRRGHLFIRTDEDADIANVKAHSKFPFAGVIDGDVTAITAGIEAADSFLRPGGVEGVSDSEIERGQDVIDEYRREHDELEDPDEDDEAHYQPIRSMDTIRRQVEIDSRANGDLGDNEAIFTVNTDQLDRHGTVIDPTGGNFESFRQNPVVLFDHGQSSTGGVPVGKVTEINRSEDRIQMRVLFDNEDPESERILSKVKRGFLHAASIGFDPIDVDRSSEPTVIREWEMVELSIVPVPSNPGALVDQRSIDELNRQIKELPERIASAMEGRGGFRADGDDLVAAVGERSEPEEAEPEAEAEEPPSRHYVDPETLRKIERARKVELFKRLLPKIRTHVRRQLGKA